MKIRKPILALLISAGLFLLGGLGCFSSAVGGFFRTPTPGVQPASFEYCGARLTELCVVSFGRDALGNGIVNLHVPQMRYPTFYLNIVRRSGEDRFDCVLNKNVKTSVYCSGAPLILGEGLEIQIHASLDDRLLAQGTFTLTAFLVPTPVVEEAQETESTRSTSTPESDETPIPAETETFSGSIETMPPHTATSAADSTSYPSYP